MKKPTPTQLEVLRRMEANDKTIRRVPGGFWITADAVLTPREGYAAPDKWCDIRTVRAMEKQEWVERTGTHPEEWRDERRLTVKGRALAFQL